MRRLWVGLLVVVVATVLWWALVGVANRWLLPAVDCLAQGGEACHSQALLGVVLLLALLALYGVWRLLKRLMGPRQ